MCGEAVHKVRVLSCLRHEGVVDLIGAKYLDSRFELFFLTHAGPHVGVQRVDAFDGIRLGVPIDLFAF